MFQYTMPKSNLPDRSRPVCEMITNMTEEMNDADAVLVRSANMHDMELPENVKVIARAGAGVNNIPVDVVRRERYRSIQHTRCKCKRC